MSDILNRINIEYCVGQTGEWKHWSTHSDPEKVYNSLGNLFDKIDEDYKGKHVAYRIIKLIDQRVIQRKWGV